MTKPVVGEIRVARLLTVQGGDGTTGLVAVSKDGRVYAWTGEGWLPLSMRVVILPDLPKEE